MQKCPQSSYFKYFVLLPLLLCLLFTTAMGVASPSAHAATAATTASSTVNDAVAQASQEFGVPAELLKALCYMEGRLSNHNGKPSLDNGFGCMHLIQNKRADTLTLAAQKLGVSTNQLKNDIALNIRGGAAVLKDESIQLSPTHTAPTKLADWYGEVAQYSHSMVRSTAIMYADALYKLLNSGFSAQTDTGETVTVAPQNVQPNTATAGPVKTPSPAAGCTNDGNVDYPGAIDCIVDPNTFDCNIVAAVDPCTYESADRPNDLTVNYVVIHDTEESLEGTMNVFQNPNSGVSIHYVVDTDGTVYQFLHDKDVGYQVGNYWYNQHSIGIEHIGWDATGFQWYNAAQYLGSAKLTAYLLNKFNIPLDHEHVVSHGTVPSPFVGTNHVDPGPYWLWTYYLNLIHKQGVPFADGPTDKHIITLNPSTSVHPLGNKGTETPANFNFFYLYQGPSTQSGLIPQLGSPSDITDETNNVETNMNYYYLAKVKDPAGTGNMMYEIWYGESDQAHSKPSSLVQHAHLAWLAVPPDAVVPGQGTAVTLTSTNGKDIPIYGKPATGATAIGYAPNNSIFVSVITTNEDGTSNLWYEINYNHREAWVPASSVTTVQGTGGQ
ncbi:N-acetylmuramoyl-L-alanine amidase [Dictyobacter formicarum]|uniref:N-acetylmuramoyl-L-alanine amidase n=1 Tax=Dictyobacter formicarum TaxID=2778368 RepID=A0ABQ3VHU7_9CHLR|nr:peptidoglycan recognition family protein [Dictyobacter formicarum]GHO84948.1 amidase [Dictyobacter formicarum]